MIRRNLRSCIEWWDDELVTTYYLLSPVELLACKDMGMVKIQ